MKRMKGGVDFTLKARLDSDVASWLKEKRFYGEKSNITSKALEFYHWYSLYRRGFLIKMIEENYNEVKELLRKIGRIKKKYDN